MATELELFLGGVDRDYARQAAKAFFDRVDEIEGKLSLYREGSDVSRINLLPVSESVRVSDECIRCLVTAMEASVLTAGRFDPFLGVESLRVKGGVPMHLFSLMSHVEHSDEAVVSIDLVSRMISKLSSGRLLDLGGIGKGFALDDGMEVLDDWEVPIALARFGGSTLLFRDLEGELGWGGRMRNVFETTFFNEAVSSSGIGYQGEHVIGNREGESWLRAYSRADTAALSDALSTAALLMGEAELQTLTEQEPSRLALAAFREGSSWGEERFCAWKNGE